MTTSFLPCALFVACHPDDIEIGTGGTVARLAATGWNVWICILTNERNTDVAAQRKTEAIAGAAALGVVEEQMIFSGFPDGDLICNAETVGTLRKILHERNCEPDIVFTHTKADSHNDHRAANEITMSTFRKKPILSYAVVNSLMLSEFSPKIFIETIPYHDQKIRALQAHTTQAMRIDYGAIERRIKAYSEPLGLQEAEPFELSVQEGAEDMLFLVQSLNDCPFHNFWYPLISNQMLTVIHSVPVPRRKEQWVSTANKEQEGIQRLFQMFAQLWSDRNPVENYRSDAANAEKMLWNSNIILSGSAASNGLTRHYFNHFEGIRYVIDYTMPDYRDIVVYDRLTGQKSRSVYEEDEFGERSVVQDIGILTIMVNPMRQTRYIIGCMGIHGGGTLACFEAISNREFLKQLSSMMALPPRGNCVGYQVLVDYRIHNNTVTIREESLHAITANI